MENKNKHQKNVFNFQLFVSEHHQDSRALVIAALMQSVNINMKLLISNTAETADCQTSIISI